MFHLCLVSFFTRLFLHDHTFHCGKYIQNWKLMVYALCHQVSNLFKILEMKTAYHIASNSSASERIIFVKLQFQSNIHLYPSFESFWMYKFYSHFIDNLTWEFFLVIIYIGKMKLEHVLSAFGRMSSEISLSCQSLGKKNIKYWWMMKDNIVNIFNSRYGLT